MNILVIKELGLRTTTIVVEKGENDYSNISNNRASNKGKEKEAKEEENLEIISLK